MNLRPPSTDTRGFVQAVLDAHRLGQVNPPPLTPRELAAPIAFERPGALHAGSSEEAQCDPHHA